MNRTRALRVLVVTPKGFLGGAERWLLSVIANTDRVEVQAVVLDPGPVVAELEAAGVVVHVVPTGPKASDIARAMRKVRVIMRDADPDVFLANGIKAATVGLPVARLAGVPSVWVRHDPSFDKTLGPLTERLANRVLVVSPPTQDECARFDPAFVPPPLLAEPVTRSEAQSRLAALGVPDDGLLRLAMFTRLATYKGVDTAIHSLALPGGERWRLVVAGIVDPGQPDEEKRLRALARDLSVEQRVTWLGQIDGIGRLAAGFDLVALLTRAGVPGYPDGEGFGMSMVEAWAAGTPVLADPATVPPLNAPEYAGGAHVVDARDPESVAQALGRLSDPVTRRAAVESSSLIGERYPRAADVSRAVVDVLADTCNRPGAGGLVETPMSVVSTVFNEGELIDDWVREILDQLRLTDELIVVDGGSTDDTVDRLRHLEGDRLRVVVAPGAGISEGRNIAVRQAGHEWVAATDAGCSVSPAWLEALRAGTTGPHDLITGTYRADPGRSAWSAALAAVAYPDPDELRRRTPLVELYGRLFGRTFDASLPTGRSVAFTKRAHGAAGGYPEDLATAEDVVFGRRVVAAGFSAALARDAEVTWAQRPTLYGNARMFYRYGHGDGRSGDRRLVIRDLARVAAYAVGPVMLFDRRTRWLSIAGAGLYFSLPMARAMSGPSPARSVALVPFVAAIRDVSKAAGCVVGLVGPRGSG